MRVSYSMSATFAAGVFFTLPAIAAYGAEVKVSGNAFHVIMSNDTVKLNDGRTLVHVHDKGIVEAGDSASPLHLAWRDCFGTMIMDAKGNFAEGAGYCEAFDKESDAYWNTWNASPEGPKWTAFHGTGKFEAISGGGTLKFIANFPDRYAISYEGTLTMK